MTQISLLLWYKCKKQNGVSLYWYGCPSTFPQESPNRPFINLSMALLPEIVVATLDTLPGCLERQVARRWENGMEIDF